MAIEMNAQTAEAFRTLQAFSTLARQVNGDEVIRYDGATDHVTLSGGDRRHDLTHWSRSKGDLAANLATRDAFLNALKTLLGQKENGPEVEIPKAVQNVLKLGDFTDQKGHPLLAHRVIKIMNALQKVDGYGAFRMEGSQVPVAEMAKLDVDVKYARAEDDIIKTFKGTKNIEDLKNRVDRFFTNLTGDAMQVIGPRLDVFADDKDAFITPLKNRIDEAGLEDHPLTAVMTLRRSLKTLEQQHVGTHVALNKDERRVFDRLFSEIIDAFASARGLETVDEATSKKMFRDFADRSTDSLSVHGRSGADHRAFVNKSLADEQDQKGPVSDQPMTEDEWKNSLGQIVLDLNRSFTLVFNGKMYGQRALNDGPFAAGRILATGAERVGSGEVHMTDEDKRLFRQDVLAFFTHEGRTDWRALRHFLNNAHQGLSGTLFGVPALAGLGPLGLNVARDNNVESLHNGNMIMTLSRDEAGGYRLEVDEQTAAVDIGGTFDAPHPLSANSYLHNHGAISFGNESMVPKLDGSCEFEAHLENAKV